MANIIDLETRRRLREAKALPAYEPDFVKVIIGDDDLGAVIRAHLFAEYRLRVLVGSKLRAGDSEIPERFFDIVTFAQRRKIISADTASALRGLNALRNKFAHQLDYELTAEALDTFVNGLGDGVIREMYDDSIPEVDVPNHSPGRERQLLRLALCAIDTGLELPPD